jgi:hypothetical protein
MVGQSHTGSGTALKQDAGQSEHRWCFPTQAQSKCSIGLICAIIRALPHTIAASACFWYSAILFLPLDRLLEEAPAMASTGRLSNDVHDEQVYVFCT